MTDCKNCLHYEVCADVMKKELFIKEKMLKIANPICKWFLDKSKIIELPCKVGDKVYEVTGRKTVSVYKVRAIRVELFSLFIEWDIVEGFVWQSLSGINAVEIGKTVFLTRKEAERALKEREDNG